MTTNPVGISGVTISYARIRRGGGEPDARAGDYTVTATLSNANYSATPVDRERWFIGQARRPRLPGPAPANITVGTRLGTTQLDATYATFDGMPLSGLLSFYTRFGNSATRGQQPDPERDVQARRRRPTSRRPLRRS